MVKKRQALGMIETKGFIGLIEATDAAVKAADVDAVDYEQVTGAIMIIKLRGTVGAVQAAVEAGAAAAERIGELVGSHVIPNPYEYVETMITPPDELKNYSKDPRRYDDRLPKGPAVQARRQAKAQARPRPKPGERAQLDLDGSRREKVLLKKAKEEGLDNLRGHELRFVARRVDNFPMSKSDIRVAGKGELLDAFHKMNFQL